MYLGATTSLSCFHPSSAAELTTNSASDDLYELLEIVLAIVGTLRTLAAALMAAIISRSSLSRFGRFVIGYQAANRRQPLST